MSETPHPELTQIESTGLPQDRLRALLFLIETRLRQRRRLAVRAVLLLVPLLVASVVLVSAAGLAIHRVYFVNPEPAYDSFTCPFGWTIALALAPFVMTFMHYLWITFVQLHCRAFNDVADLLQTTDHEEFRPCVRLEMLSDDGSLIYILRNLFTVDKGLAAGLFALGGIACGLLPVAAQAFASVGAVVLIWRANAPVAAGAGFFYVLFFLMAASRTAGLFSFFRRLH